MEIMNMSDKPTVIYDSEKANMFSGRMLTALNNGALCLMISIGHRTGLFDAMHGLPPSGITDIAKKSSLAERYVKEWLGAMVTSRCRGNRSFRIALFSSTRARFISDTSSCRGTI